MYRSGSRSSASSHRPKDGGDGGLRLARGSGSSSGSLRRLSPPSCSSASSSRPPARRHRSPSGHRGRRASPSPSPPPRSRRSSPSPPRGRRVSRSPSWSRRGSPSPSPRSRRLYPPGPSGFRGSGRGDGRGDHLGDGGIRRQSPGMCSDSLEQSLRITVGNDHFCIGTPERRRLSDHLGSPVDNLEDMDRDDLTDDSVFTRSSQCSRGLQHYISQEEGPLSPVGQREDYRTRETFQHQSEYSPHISCHDELLWGAEQSRDRLKGSYSIRSEERSREAKRPRYDDTEKIHSMGGDRPSFLSGTHNYRQHRQSPSHRFLDPEFRELDLARRKREEEEERNRSLSQELLGVDNGGTSCSIPGLSGVLATPEPGYALHRPKEVPVMPKKSILKKRIEVDMKPSMQLESFSSSTSSSQSRPLYSDHSSLQLSGAIAAFASEAENKGNTVETAPKEPQRNPYHWGALPEMPKDSNPLREQFGSFLCCKENLDSKAEGLERHGDFLLPHERASQDGSGFSQILSVLADPTSAQEKRQCGFPDIEDEEKFLYGDEEEDLRAESPPQSLGDPESEVRRQEASSLPSVAAATQLESQEETNPEYAKIHDLLKTIGLDIGVVEISKLAARTQERLHGKKPSSRSSADHRSSVDQQFSTDSCSSIDPCFSADQCASDPHRLESRELHYSNARSLEMSHAHPASPVDRYLLRKNSSPFLKSDHPVGHISRSEVAGSGFHSSVAVRCRLPPVPSPVRLPYPASLSQFHMPRASHFATARIPPNYQRSPIPSASFEAYRHYMAYAVSRWPLYPAPQPSNHPLPESHKTSASKNVTHSRPNLRVVPIKGNAPQKKKTTKGSVPATQVPAQVPIPKGSVPAAQVPIPKGSVPAAQVPIPKGSVPASQVPIPKGSVPASQVPIPKGSVPAAQVPNPPPMKCNPEKISDEKNRATQKQKVIEEREKLKSDQEARQKKMFYLKTELERLHKQQGEMLRKKRREKDGHKDPLLLEVSRLQDNITKDIAQLQQEVEEAEKKQSELDKVAQILGINISDKSVKSSSDSKEPMEKPENDEKPKSPESALALSNSSSDDQVPCGFQFLQQLCLVIRWFEGQHGTFPGLNGLEVKTQKKKSKKLVRINKNSGPTWADLRGLISQATNTLNNTGTPMNPVNLLLAVMACVTYNSDKKESKVNNEKSHIKSLKPAESPQPSTQQSDQPVATYEYYDAGSHWCKDCNAICGTMFDFFTHMHNKKHTQTLDPYNRPWASKTQSESKQDAEKRTDKITVPAKGSEFLIPITGFYCQLCEEFLGDSISGEQHVKGHQHNEKYKKYVEENPLYEDRRNLDHQAGLAVVLETERRRQIELKRKLSEKPKEEKKEKMAKVTKESKEDDKVSVELGNQHIEDGNSPEKAENKRNASIKLQVKEEIKKESPVACFGKFSWKKPEKEEKSSLVAPSLPKEENVENSKDKEDLKAEAGKAKPIKIKLSGKTVVAHTSPWVPVVRTSPQTKIRPNLPIPPTVLRKPCSVTVSKPAPLNTFLSIKSSGTPAKPLPVVKESSTDLLLPPDIISKAFGGEEVVLKGSPEEKAALAEKNEPSQITEQILAPPPPPPPPPVTHPAVPSSAPAKKSVSVVPQPLSPGFQGPNILNPVLPMAFVASEQPAAIPSDETAPGVSENDQDQTPFSMLVRPPPPLSSVFSEQAKKLEKRNSCLATANAKDLYDIFYSSGGKGAPETKLGGGTLANGESSSFSKTECTDTSSSTLNSTVFQGEMPKDKGLVTAIVSNSKQPTEKWSVLEHVNPKSRNSSYDFLQPLTRLCQNKPYETIPPKADVWASNSFHSDSTRDRPPERRTDFGQGKPEPPGVDLAHLSDTNCHAEETQLVRIDLIDSDNQGKKSQELYQSTDCKESEIKNIEPKGKVAIVEGTSANVSPQDIDFNLSHILDFNLSHGNRDVGEEREQPTLPMTDTKAEQSGKLLTGHENPSTVVIELSTQSFSSSKVKIDSFPSEARSLLQNPQDMPEKMSTAELLKSPAKSSICLTDSPQQKGVSAGNEKEVENSVPESASKTAKCRSLKLKKNVSMMCEQLTGRKIRRRQRPGRAQSKWKWKL